MREIALSILGLKLLTVLSFLPSAWSATPAASATSEEASSTSWGKVENASFSSGISVTGRVIPQDGALTVQAARVQGRITSILRREGERVRKDDALFEISSGECSSLAAEKRVSEKGGLKELADGVAQRERELSIRQQDGKCFIVSGASGVIAKRSVEVGAAFNPGDTLAQIIDLKRMAIELDVPEHELTHVKIGDRVSVAFASDSTTKVQTEIANILPTVDPATRAVKARVKPVTLPSGTSLEALVFGEIDTGREVARLQVPSSALVFSRNQLYVVKGPTQQPSSVPVHVLNENDKQSIIEPMRAGDLKAGDEIAVKGAIYLLRKLRPEAIP